MYCSPFGCNPANKTYLATAAALRVGIESGGTRIAFSVAGTIDEMAIIANSARPVGTGPSDGTVFARLAVAALLVAGTALLVAVPADAGLARRAGRASSAAAVRTFAVDVALRTRHRARPAAVFARAVALQTR